MGSIHYQEMIEEMDRCDEDNGDHTFSLVYDKCDIRRETGGERVTIDKAQKCGLPYHCADHEMRGIINTESGKKSAVHLRLIFEFNDKTVYW